MHDINLGCNAPQIHELGKQPEKRAQHGYFPSPHWLVGAVGANEFDINAFQFQQLNELLALVCHTSGWRRKGSNNTDTRQGSRSSTCAMMNKVNHLCWQHFELVGLRQCGPWCEAKRPGRLGM